MNKYEILKNKIYEVNAKVSYAYSWSSEDDFGNGMKEALRKIIEIIEELENKNGVI